MTDAQSHSSWSDQFLPGAGAQPGQGSEGLISLAVLRGLLFRQRSILIGVTTAVLVIGLVITLLTRPQYEAVATVRVDPSGVSIVEGQDLAPQVAVNEMGRYMNTLGEVIKSKRMAYQVVDDLNLASNKDFLGEAFAKGPPQGQKQKQWLNERREAAALMAQGGVSVDIPGDTRLLSIKFSSLSPQSASLLANGYADAFVKDDLRRTTRSNEYARTYLQDQIQKIGARLQDAEFKANAYAKQNRLVGNAMPAQTDPAQTGDTAPTGNAGNLANVNSTYSTARINRISAEQRWRAIASVPALQLPEVQSNATIQALQTDRSQLSGKLAELRQRYGDEYPQVREAKAQVAALDSQLTRIASGIKNSARDQYEVALRQEQGISSELNSVSTQTLDEQDRRVRYSQLEREAGALRAQLSALLERFNQISAAANIDSGTISKLDDANTPGAPISPNLVKNLLVALVLGAGLATVIAVLREAFDDRLRSSDDVERKLGTNLLGFTPYLSQDEVAEQLRDPFSSLMESYASLRTSVDFALVGDHRLIQITSSQPSEGKSLTSTTLARKYAQLGRRTLLIDADLRKPTINHLFGAKRSQYGFAEVILGDIELAQALVPDTPENLDVLPVGSIPPSPVELLSSQRFSDFLERCRERYDLVIVDSSPVMGLADAPLIAQHVDGVIFIVEANRSHHGQAKTALRRLRSAGANVIGTVLTKYRSAEAGLSYDYAYNYYSYGNDSKA